MRQRVAVTRVGIVQRIGVEGGLLALVTDAGECFEILGPPEGLVAGQRIEAVLESRAADVSIGMMGKAVRIQTYRVLHP